MSAVTAVVICVFVLSGLYTTYLLSDLWDTIRLSEEEGILDKNDRKELSLMQRWRLASRDPLLNRAKNDTMRTIAMLAVLELSAVAFYFLQ